MIVVSLSPSRLHNVAVLAGDRRDVQASEARQAVDVQHVDVAATPNDAQVILSGVCVPVVLVCELCVCVCVCVVGQTRD